MPQPAVIEDHSRRLSAPSDWKEEENGHCSALFIRDVEIDGLRYMRSAWEFTPLEAHQLLAGSKMVLGISGVTHPVCHLIVDDPPVRFDPVVVARRFTTAHGRPAVRAEQLVPGKPVRRVWCEEPVDEAEGLGIAIGRAVDKMEQMIKENGW